MKLNGESPIIIVGLSGVGKSTYAKQLAEKYSYQLISTDMYLEFGDYGSDRALRMLESDVRNARKVIVEGSLCYRLLRNGLRYNNFHPPLIIHVGAREAIRQLRRPDKDYSRTDHIYKTIWMDYMNMLQSHINKPRIEYVDTTNLI